MTIHRYYGTLNSLALSPYAGEEEMDVKEVLREALSAVEAVNLPEDLRLSGFEYALAALSNPSVQNHVSSVSSHLGGSRTRPHDNESPLAEKALQYSVDLDILHETYTTSDDGISLTVPVSQLPPQIKAGLHSIALVLCFIRQGLGIEEFTPQEEIGRIADEYGVKDSNFSRNMQAMSSLFQVKTENSKRHYKLRRTGWEEAAKLINCFGGEEH